MHRYRASEPDKWDYPAAGVPTPLTEELESQQQAKQVMIVMSLTSCCVTPQQLQQPSVYAGPAVTMQLSYHANLAEACWLKQCPEFALYRHHCLIRSLQCNGRAI